MKQNMIAAFLVLVAPLLAFQSAQAFPDRPIKLVVASPAGGPPDVMARLLSEKMAASLGQPVIVENRAGAGGTIGARSVAAAEPDGYTLVMGSTSTLLIARRSTRTPVTTPEHSHRSLVSRTAVKSSPCIRRFPPDRWPN
jgi:tripartite-type tricarboxylate transporter receptor subunit TctC